MNHKRLAHCTGASVVESMMVLRFDFNLCRTCTRFIAHTEAKSLGIMSKVTYLTPRFNNGCRNYLEANYVDYEEIVNSSATTCHFTQRNTIQ